MNTATQISADTRDADYDALLAAMRSRVAELKDKHLFQVDLGDRPYDLFLDALPEHDRQHHRCHECRRFVEAYGNLVTINDAGEVESVMWRSTDVRGDNVYARAVATMSVACRRAKVIGVHHSSARVWGNARTHDKKRGMDWTHFAVTPPAHLVGGRTTAEHAHERECLVRGLAEYPDFVVRTAVAALKSGALARPEKCLAIAEWFEELHTTVSKTKNREALARIIWRAAAMAPAGWCHVRSSMIGTLLDDIVAGTPMADAARKFAAKMNPLQYQRPQAAPTTGNIAAAEKLMAELGIAGALQRRFAAVEDLESLWVPTPDKAPPAGAGVFAHLVPKGAAPTVKDLGLPAQTMTWSKFARDVLPRAERIELLAPARGNYFAFVTGPRGLFQWEHPVSMYLYHGGSSAHAWGVAGWVGVDAVTRDPAHWFGNVAAHHADRVFFVLRGAKDLRHVAGGGFFPETLRAELRPIRATLEAFAKTATIAGRDTATACGLVFGDGAAAVRVRATVAGIRTEYNLDRME